jgi:hypothetical protein
MKVMAERKLKFRAEAGDFVCKFGIVKPRRAPAAKNRPRKLPYASLEEDNGTRGHVSHFSALPTTLQTPPAPPSHTWAVPFQSSPASARLPSLPLSEAPQVQHRLHSYSAPLLENASSVASQQDTAPATPQISSPPRTPQPSLL